ncbi:hypothetical protein BaRGS_00007142 [Batillaria attramentaria]|uniref:Uncharacterized protein n=1 Tax=Batillaria attramentaria TaxID=370345 RepID=A0ABD0LRC9_9CAEN
MSYSPVSTDVSRLAHDLLNIHHVSLPTALPRDLIQLDPSSCASCVCVWLECRELVQMPFFTPPPPFREGAQVVVAFPGHIFTSPARIEGQLKLPIQIDSNIGSNRIRERNVWTIPPDMRCRTLESVTNSDWESTEFHLSHGQPDPTLTESDKLESTCSEECTPIGRSLPSFSAPSKQISSESFFLSTAHTHSHVISKHESGVVVLLRCQDL